MFNADIPFLEVEDVRPGKEQGQTDLWGIPEALTQHIFQFLPKKNFMLFQRVSKSAKSAVDNSRGLLYDAYQERLGELREEVPRWGQDWGEGLPRSWHGYKCKCKNRVSIDLGLGDNSRITGYVVQVADRFVTYVREETILIVN